MKEVKRRFIGKGSMGKGSRKGFTLVELMIVIAILAILSAVAISQYSAYKNKAKAKDLVGFARACAMEILTQCLADSSFDSDDINFLESCDNSTRSTKYLTNVNVEASFTNCDNFTVEATGVVNGGPAYKVTCTYNRTVQSISCTSPQKS